MISEAISGLMVSLPSDSCMALSVAFKGCGREGRRENGQKKYMLILVEYIYAIQLQ